MTIFFFLSSTLLNLRAATYFPIGKAILSGQNAFSNETAISSYIKELKAKACTLQFLNKNPIVEIIILNNQNWEQTEKNRKLGITDSKKVYFNVCLVIF